MKHQVTGIACGLLAALIWGGFPVVTRLGVARGGLDTYDVTFIRFAVSGLLLLPVILRRPVRQLGPGPILLMIAGVGAPYVLIVSAALGLAPVSYFALTPGSMIVFTALLSQVLLHRKLAPSQVGGIVAVVVGLLIATSSSLLLDRVPASLAFVLFLAAGVLWAMYNVVTKIWSADALTTTAIVSVGSAVLYAPVYLAWRGTALLDAPTATLAVQVLYQGVLVSIFGLFLFTRAVAILGPALGATFAALVPLLATLEAQVLLGERPSLLALTGIVVVTAGMAASLYQPKPRAPRAVAT